MGTEGVVASSAEFHRSHAKGICVSGYFVGNTVGLAMRSASAFSGDKIPVVARYPVGGGNPKASDKGKSARGLALQFTLPKGERCLNPRSPRRCFL